MPKPMPTTQDFMFREFLNCDVVQDDQAKKTENIKVEL